MVPTPAPTTTHLNPAAQQRPLPAPAEFKHRRPAPPRLLIGRRSRDARSATASMVSALVGVLWGLVLCGVVAAGAGSSVMPRVGVRTLGLSLFP